ncbi:twin-arginine translocation signal domain-containing protein [Gammaproteobacteria bacterium]|nr:twin-arginine translocation signal domain-containing protein [Gammaproteobacteria bacterium]
MDRRYFIKNTAIAGTAMAIVPASMLFTQQVQKSAGEFMDYTSDKVNALNDYALGAILPSLASLAIYAYTMELIYVVLFIFLLLSAGIII